MLKLSRTKEQMGNFSFDGENAFPRIESLLKAYWESRPEVDIERARIYTQSYKETEGEAAIIRRAKAFREYCDKRNINIPQDQLIVGDTAIKPRAGAVDPIFHTGWLSQELYTIADRKQDPYHISKEDRKELEEEIFPYWSGKSVHEHWLKQIPPWVRELAVKTGIIDVEIKTQSAAGETAPYYEMLIKKGFGKIKEEAREHIESLDLYNPQDYEKITFYQASLLTMEGLSSYIMRHGKMAEQAAKTAEGNRQQELMKIAENCYYLAEGRPETFWQGLQFVYFILVGCMMEGNGPSYSPGRVDQYLYELYDQDIKAGRLTMEEALELIEAFYIKTAETTWFLSENACMYFAGYQPFHSIILGGIDKRGNDVTNELSYLFLTAKMVLLQFS